ncbi:MAG: hypothetical protein KJ050_03040 [Candidatus Omnitrophica bacterium]|jgi:Uncharacterized protein conserved in bacteria|nr:MAG: Protein MraZ [Candidatus Hinthialibacteria bacterium OLB16]MBE7489553.1 hypothetical protein [bacterium]MBK7495170.1 hypothetical protein [Candidatus Omnitrophota bacterium]MCE7907338.1 hypothetical protein [Candidatus Omnitrophica bacterium COP1]MBV6483202.1 Transcriptional regulator MraZ [bacterium]
MAGLVGYFERTLDEKNRLVLPPELRRRLDSQVFISRWYDNSLGLFDEEEYSTLAEALNGQGSHNPEVRRARREIFGGASLVAIDNQGRMTLPERLLDGFLLHKEKDRDLVLLGDWNKVILHSGMRYKDMETRDRVELDEALSSVEQGAMAQSRKDSLREKIEEDFGEQGRERPV